MMGDYLTQPMFFTLKDNNHSVKTNRVIEIDFTNKS